MASFKPVVHLQCEVQSYAWGKVGGASQVAQLRLGAHAQHQSLGSAGFDIDENKPYAELWMGSHPKAPATVVGSHIKSDLPFIQYLNENAEACLGEAVANEYDGKLPFLFKVLSISKALSIQAHPTKDHAKILHERAPDKYPDPNHKPEMAIALTPFKAMCGFRRAEEISTFFKNIPELKAVIGQVQCDAFIANPSTETLKDCFSALMYCEDSVIAENLSHLVKRLEALKSEQGSFSAENEAAYNASILLVTYGQFPDDVGCFALYFLNIIDLQPGQAIFLGPNVPHAYMSGDCVECMATSDNVVRAGLTPKFKDKSTLCDMLDYQMSSADCRIFQWHADPDSAECHIYDPPVPEFTVVHGSYASGQHTVKARPGPSIVLITEGQGTIESKPDTSLSFGRGSVLFIGANADWTLACQAPVQFYQAVCYPASK